MLLIDDDDELPGVPDQGEVEITARLGADGLRAIDAALMNQATTAWLKIAKVIHCAIEAGSLPIDDDTVDLHARRVVTLIASGQLELQGDPRRPRWSEVRLSVA